ncbi:hypothetical protein METBIDRAFT_75984 [Metschnikowia bicuspidata var. bicuspidata NRRL YB-4993]|uniref:Uncharacterized protein n=1 Tax=Metschnikowia bicuspidata var. bicuspidata NRRL YB-4993 TaxID=869754 RepID=A0A1A0HFQ2_9ASCO|nr:hypothetical protein METBIDRAFT_75984 [Metschnikowia bicuspidata var. bicuspidata NRRL YB-4993]OBA22815.1 hypothetical protein METBIDRAFT_75984 [Metschnikowia bicuspidata var. bicuspidata NRRL YB-4993]
MSRYNGLSFFARAPLTYETLAERCRVFGRQNKHPPAQLVDYILANRKLQKINRGLGTGLRFGTLGSSLGLPLNVSSARLEQDLWLFVCKYWAPCVASDHVVTTYVCTNKNGNVSTLFRLVRENFASKLSGNVWPSTGPVTALTHVLLRENDFHGCFRLIDDTVNSAESMDLRRHQLLRQAAKTGVAAFTCGLGLSVWYTLLATSDILGLLDGVADLWPVLALSLASGLGTFLGFQWLKAASLPRILWRPHTSMWHRVLHFEEALFVNKIVTYYEEYNEVNVKNFHLSEVREQARLDVLDQSDYELHLPDPASGADDHDKIHATEALTRYFRQELYLRKMVWRPFKEQKMFLDFWLSHGDSYEWVEPDQDPAEMAFLRPLEDAAKPVLSLGSGVQARGSNTRF